MADAAAPATTLAEDTVTKQTHDEVKRLAEAKTAENAALAAELETFRDQERNKLKSFADTNREFFQYNVEFAPAESKTDFQNMISWVDTAPTLPNLQQQMQLGRVIHACASNLKRVREEASVQATAATQLGETAKQLEEMKADRDLKDRRVGELSKSLEEMQANQEILEKKLAAAGIMAEKYNFSNVTSREAEPKKDAESAARVEVKTENASKVAAPGNPASALLAFVGASRSCASGRFMPTGNSNHSYLGAPAGDGLASMSFLPM